MEQIKAGSYSTLKKFEQCKFRVKLEKIDKIPEPDRGPPPAKLKGEWQNDRGNRVHDHAEGFVKGDNDGQCKEMIHFTDDFNHMNKLFLAGLVIPEQMWCFDKNWQPVKETQKAKIKFRIKIDAFVFNSIAQDKAVVIDYKTGKRYGNEMDHEQQKQLYAIGGFLRFPSLSYVLTELWYLDLPDEPTYPLGYNKVQAMALLKRSWAVRNEALLNETMFKPSPSTFSCRWCPYNMKNKSEACPHAVL